MGFLYHSTVQDLCDANVSWSQASTHPIHQVRWATVQDASSAIAGEDHSQKSFLGGATFPRTVEQPFHPPLLC